MMRKNLPPATEYPVNLQNTPISHGIWGIMQRCWRFDPDARPDAQTVLAEFDALGLQQLIGGVQEVIVGAEL
jgi:hypothetical protein